MPAPRAPLSRAGALCSVPAQDTEDPSTWALVGLRVPTYLSPPQEPESASLAPLERRKSDKHQLENSGTKPFKTKPGLFGLTGLGDAFCVSSPD